MSDEKVASFDRPQVPIPDFATIIRNNPLWVAYDDVWKEYHWWLDNEAECFKCKTKWKDRKHVWTCEVDCGCPPVVTRDAMENLALKTGDQKMLGIVGVSVHIVRNKP